MTSSPSITTIFSPVVTSTLGDYHSINPDPRFIGYYVGGEYDTSDPYILNCSSSSTWFTSGTAGACCRSSSGCTWPIACTGGSTLLLAGNTTTCSSGFKCITDRVLDHFTSTYTTMSCDVTYQSGITVSRQILEYATSIIVSTIEPSGSSSSASPASTASAGISQTSSLSSTQASGDLSTQPTNSSPSPDNNGSKAWIAGAVVGPVVGAALIAGLIFFLWRRQRSHRARSAIDQDKAANGAGKPVMSPTMR